MTDQMLQQLARETADEICQTYDVTPPRGRYYVNSVQETIVIIIEQRFLSALRIVDKEAEERTRREDIEAIKKIVSEFAGESYNGLAREAANDCLDALESLIAKERSEEK